MNIKEPHNHHIKIRLSRTLLKPYFIKKICLSLLLLILLVPPSAIAGNKTLIILPLVIYADQSKTFLRQGLRSMLISRLSGEGLEVVGDDAFGSLLNKEDKEGIKSKDRAEELARKLKVNYAIFGSITTIGGGYSLDLSIIEIKKTGAKLTKVSEAMEEARFIPKMADVAYQFRAIITGEDIRPHRMAGRSGDKSARGLFFQPTGVYQSFKPTGRLRLKTEIMAFDMADLNGDGETELLILSREKLLIYNRKDEYLVLKDTFKASRGESFLKVSAGDADRNGRAEIYLVSRYGDTARTSILEWGGKFKRTLRESGHFQVVSGLDGKKDMLLFQDSGMGNFFIGGIYLMNYGGGKPARQKQLNLPKGAQFYTITPYDLNKDGSLEFIGLGPPDFGDKGYLYVWDRNGEALWRNDEKIGGTNNVIEFGKTITGDDVQPRSYMNSRVVVTDIDGDGKNEVLAVKSTSMLKYLNILIYIKSKLTAYSIQGMELVPAWTTRNISYCITDMQARGGTLYLAGQKGRWSELGKGSGAVMWFE